MGCAGGSRVIAMFGGGFEADRRSSALSRRQKNFPRLARGMEDVCPNVGYLYNLHIVAERLKGSGNIRITLNLLSSVSQPIEQVLNCALSLRTTALATGFGRGTLNLSLMALDIAAFTRIVWTYDNDNVVLFQGDGCAIAKCNALDPHSWFHLRASREHRSVNPLRR